MPTRLEFRIPFRKLLIGLLVTVVPISIAGLYAISKSDSALQETIGNHYKTIAAAAAGEVSQFIHDRVLRVAVMATDPAVVAAIEQANRSYQGTTESAFQARVERVEKEWNTSAAQNVVEQILSSPAARRLRRLQELDRSFLRFTVTDEKGATVAATQKTLDYYQADEDYWQAIHAQGRGAVNLTDILYDEVTKSNYIGVGVPVTEQGSNRFIGTVDALIDVSSIFPVVNRAHEIFGLTTTLVKSDGTVITAPGVGLSMNLKSQEYAAVQDALQTLEGRETGYLVADIARLGRQMIGFADAGLQADYQNLGWVVLVSRNEEEALAALRTVGRLNAFLALLGLAMVTLLAVYFSIHREHEITDLEAIRSGEAPPAEPPRVRKTAT